MTNPVEIISENRPVVNRHPGEGRDPVLLPWTPASAGVTNGVPPPIRIALSILGELAPERAEKLRKPLPAYAMTLARQGKEVTEQTLRDALSKGDDAIIGPRLVFNRVAQTIEQRYERITSQMPKWGGILKDDPTSSLNERMLRAVYRDDLVSIQGFIKQGADVRAENDWVLRCAARNGHYNTTHFLLQKGADIAAVDSYYLQNFDSALKNIDLWLKVTGDYPPEGLEDKKPRSFDVPAVKFIGALISNEGYFPKSSHRYAYNAVAFFGSAEKVMDYFEKWAVSSKQPLHDALQMIPDQLPCEGGDPVVGDVKKTGLLPSQEHKRLSAWRDAVMQQGPEMAKLIKFSDKIPQPLKSADGKTWSLTKTREEAAKFAYLNGKENPALAALFNKHQIDEEGFNDALKIVKEFKGKTENRIPNITIDGASFGLPKASFKKLPDGDFRGLVLGQITDCCQSIGSAGAECAKHGFTSENGGFYVVATNDNEIIGQIWAWRGTKGELVLDSLETLGQRVNKEQWTSLTTEFAKALKGTDVTALHIGTGGKTPHLPFKTYTRPATPKDYNGYRDSKSQYQVIFR